MIPSRSTWPLRGPARPVRLASTLLAAVALMPMPVAAHPHVFIDHSITLVFDAGDLVALRFSWTFDEMYSSLLRADYVKSKGPLTPEDVRELEKNAFSNLDSYDFFTVLRVDDKPVKFTKVRDFTARLEGARINYTFTVPVKPEVSGRGTVVAAVFDPEYYVYYRFTETAPYALEHAEGVAADCTITPDKQTVPVYGMIDTDTLVCSYRRKG
jgi:ABC-type uncharacterized transport system substrate-binding protein